MVGPVKDLRCAYGARSFPECDCSVGGGCFYSFSSVPGVSGMFYIWFVASGDLRSVPGDPEQCLECGSWLELGLLVLFHLWLLFIVFGLCPDEIYMILSVIQCMGVPGVLFWNSIVYLLVIVKAIILPIHYIELV
jgi:hypothetical protein